MSSSCVKLCGSDALADASFRDALKGLHSALGYVSIRRRKSGTSLDCRIREFKMTVVRSHREDPNLASGPHILYNVCLHECLSIKLARHWLPKPLSGFYFHVVSELWEPEGCSQESVGAVVRKAGSRVRWWAQGTHTWSAASGGQLRAAPRALQRCQEWAAQGEPHSRTAGAAVAAIRTLTGSANNSCGTIFLFGQRGKGHCSQIGLFNNTCMHS